MMSAVLGGLGAGLLVRHHRLAWSLVVSGLLVQPLLTLLGGASWVLVRLRQRMRRRRADLEAARLDVGTLAELVGLGLSAGLNLRQALEAGAQHVHPLLRAEVAGVLQQSAHLGLAGALATTDGLGDRLYLVSARAVATGAPLGTAVDAFARELAAAHHARQVAAAHRLPVRLMVPLALFILPGFVLLTVGPAVLAALDRIVLPVP